MPYLISPIFVLILLAYLAAVVIGEWICFQKAKQPGWASIVPIYSNYVLSKIATGKSTLFWVFTICGFTGGFLSAFQQLYAISVIISLATSIIGIVLTYKFFKSFGLSGTGAVLATLFPFIGTLVVAFGEYEYVGPELSVTE